MPSPPRSANSLAEDTSVVSQHSVGDAVRRAGREQGLEGEDGGLSAGRRAARLQ